MNRLTWPRIRAAAATVATAGLALLAAGCGGSPGSHVAQLGSTTTQTTLASPPAQANGAVAYSGCMRAHGVQNFPDPSSGGGIPKVGLQQLGVSASRFQAAQTACRHLLPNGGSPPSQAQIEQVRAEALSFSECVRAHGVQGFPDPDSTGRIPDPATDGINQGSPKFEAANNACAKYRPPYMPSNAAYRAYVRSQGS